MHRQTGCPVGKRESGRESEGCLKALGLLQARGGKGVTSTEGPQVGIPRLQARIQTLRQQGWPISTLPTGHGRISRYVLPDGAVQGAPLPDWDIGVRVLDYQGVLVVEVMGTSVDPLAAERLADRVRDALGLAEDDDSPAEETWIDEVLRDLV